MAGKGQPSTKLNNTLLMVASLLNKAEFKNWFVSYGTLLGIIREGSCIENDDDVDIIIDKSDRDKIRLLLAENNLLPLLFDNERIFKTNVTEDYASVDFYFADVLDNGTYDDVWNMIKWTNCLPLHEEQWRGTTLLLPNLPELKLENLYGETWRVPAAKKTTPGRTV